MCLTYCFECRHCTQSSHQATDGSEPSPWISMSERPPLQLDDLLYHWCLASWCMIRLQLQASASVMEVLNAEHRASVSPTYPGWMQDGWDVEGEGPLDMFPSLTFPLAAHMFFPGLIQLISRSDSISLASSLLVEVMV